MKKDLGVEEQKSRKTRTLLLLAVPIIIYIILAVFLSQLTGVPEQEREFYKYDNGYPYPYSVDSLFYYKGALDLSAGTPSSDITGISYVEYGIFKAGRFFNNDFTMIEALYFMPLIFGIISIILIFFIAKKTVNELAAFIASVLFSVHYLMARIFQAGYGDNDPFNIMFSLLFIFLFVETVYSIQIKSKKNAIVFGVLSLLALALFALIWNGYYYIIVISALFLIVYAFLSLYSKKDYKKLAILFIALAIIAVFAGVFLREEIFESRLYQKLSPSTISTGGYPDWASNIQELRGADFSKIKLYAGGWIFLIAAAVGLFGFAKTARLDNEKGLFKIYLSLFFVFSLIGTVMAIRSNRFFVFSLIILASAGIVYFAGIISPIIARKYKKASLSTATVISLAVLILFIISIVPSTLKYINNPPLMEDSVYITAKKISEKTDQTAIVTSWWDEGHFYKAYSDRTVTIRAHPNPQIMYLLSRALATSNENESLAALKILNCGNVYSELVKKDIILAAEEADCIPSQQILVLSSWAKNYADLMYINANWDFEKGQTTLDAGERPIGDFRECSNGKNAIICGQYSVDLDTFEALYKGRPMSFIYTKNQTVYFKDRGSNYVMILYKVGSGYESVGVRKDFINSVFVKLYFLNGAGLQHFKKFSEVIAAKRTIAYEVDYDLK